MLSESDYGVNMGKPILDIEALPYKIPPRPDETQTVSLDTPEGPLEFGLISMGNPHAVTAVDS